MRWPSSITTMVNSLYQKVANFWQLKLTSLRNCYTFFQSILGTCHKFWSKINHCAPFFGPERNHLPPPPSLRIPTYIFMWLLYPSWFRNAWQILFCNFASSLQPTNNSSWFDPPPLCNLAMGNISAHTHFACAKCHYSKTALAIN